MGGAFARPSSVQSGRIIVLPDIQIASAAGHDVLQAMFDYCIVSAPDVVLSVGDLTDYGGSFYADWAPVAEGFARLTVAGVDWMVATGNHDYTDRATRAALVNTYLTAPAGWTLREAGHVENAWKLVDLGAQQWLVICLEWSPRTAVVEWAVGVVAAHPGVPTIVTTHAYLYRDGTRFDWKTKGDAQVGNPHTAGLETTPAEGIHDGEELWSELIAPSPQIRLVLSGHSSPHVGPIYLTSTRAGGSRCHQILQDYQGDAPFGGGWLVEYDLDHANNRLLSRTYSPHLRAHRYGDAANDLCLELLP